MVSPPFPLASRGLVPGPGSPQLDHVNKRLGRFVKAWRVYHDSVVPSIGATGSANRKSRNAKGKRKGLPQVATAAEELQKQLGASVNIAKKALCMFGTSCLQVLSHPHPLPLPRPRPHTCSVGPPIKPPRCCRQVSRLTLRRLAPLHPDDLAPPPRLPARHAPFVLCRPEHAVSRARPEVYERAERNRKRGRRERRRRRGNSRDPRPPRASL